MVINFKVLTVLCIFHVNPMRYYYPDFIDEETETQVNRLP